MKQHYILTYISVTTIVKTASIFLNEIQPDAGTNVQRHIIQKHKCTETCTQTNK